MRTNIAIVVLLLLLNQAFGQNYCMYFTGAANGNNNNVKIPALNLTSLPVTLEAWFKPDGTQNDYASILFSRNGSATPTGVFLRPTFSNELRSNWANNQSTTTTNLIVTNNVWHHVALVVTATTKSLYLDGVLFSYTVTTNPIETFDTPTNIGWDDAALGRTFKGYIDEVRIWNTERTAQQLEENKYQSLTGNESGLVAYFRFDDQASTATDYSVNTFDAPINGATYVGSDVFTPMTFTNASSYQPSKEVMKNAQDNPVFRIKINTSNKAEALQLSQLVLNTNGTTSNTDISKITVYYCGSDSTFKTTSLFGTINGTSINGDFTITGTQELLSGANYFWVTYDISKYVTDGNKLDAECVSLSLNGASPITAIPQPTNPPGYLTVNNSYLIPFKKIGTDVVSTSAVTVSSGANFVSFQQDAITTYKGYQYVAYWNTTYRVCLARKKMPGGSWEVAEFADYIVTAARVADNHYSISFGICPKDGTIHLAFDHHGDILHYRKSVTGLANNPQAFLWNSSQFGDVLNYLVAGSNIELVTYPRFIIKPDSNLLFECRIGTSGGGDNYLWEYTAQTGLWSSIGKYADGISLDPDQNPYINGMHYDQNGRLHTSWVWRVTPDPVTNHDVYYTYSDDNGRTWKNYLGNVVGTVNSNPLSLNTAGLKVISLNQNRGLINQESQVVDSKGGIHILQSYLLDTVADNSTNFWGSRDNSYLRHIYRDAKGVWKSDVIPAISRNRSQIAIDRHDNLYVVSPEYRIYYAAASTAWQMWAEFDLSGGKTCINEGLIDREALLKNDVLSFVFAQLTSKVVVPYYLIENTDKGTGTGLRGAYFNDTTFTDLSFQNIDSLNYNWGHKRAFAGVAPDTFSVEWEGIIETQYAEQHTLYFTTSACIKVWINNTLVIDNMNNSTPYEFSFQLPLVASHRYDIRIEATYKAQAAGMKMEWESVSQARTVVPKSQSYGADYLLSTTKIHEIRMVKGWNLVTVNFLPDTSAVQKVFPNATVVKSIKSCYLSSQQAYLNSLTRIEAGEAYLVLNDVDETLKISGKLFEVQSTTYLKKGWNLFAYPLRYKSAIDSILTNCKDGLQVVKTFDKYQIPKNSSSTLLQLEPTKAYFIKMDQNCEVNWYNL